MLEKTKERLMKGEMLRYVAFGDSITEGYGVSEGWPAKLVRELAKKYPKAVIELVNKGRAGDTLEDGLFRLEGDVLAADPNLVSVNFAINDAFSNVSLATFEHNAAEMLGALSSRTTADIFVITSEVMEDEAADKLVRKYYDKLQKVCREQRVCFIDVHRVWHQKLREGIELSSLLISGLDHPNEEGYRIFARTIAEQF